jgi:hypothetical protein
MRLNRFRRIYTNYENLLFVSSFLSLSVHLSVCLHVCLSAHMEYLNSQWTDFHEIYHLIFFENLSRKFNFHQNLTKVTDTSNVDQRTCKIKPR